MPVTVIAELPVLLMRSTASKELPTSMLPKAIVPLRPIIRVGVAVGGGGVCCGCVGAAGGLLPQAMKNTTASAASERFIPMRTS